MFLEDKIKRGKGVSRYQMSGIGGFVLVLPSVPMAFSRPSMKFGSNQTFNPLPLLKVLQELAKPSRGPENREQTHNEKR